MKSGRLSDEIKIMSVSFCVEDVQYVIPTNKIPDDSLLLHLAQLPGAVQPISLSITSSQLEQLYQYLVNDVVSEDINMVLLAMNISPIRSYQSACLIENDMRKNMYVTQHQHYYQPQYGLNQLTEERYMSMFRALPTIPNLLFTGDRGRCTWGTIKSNLKILKMFTSIPGVFVGGGCIYSILHGYPINDVDLFLHGLDEKQAEATLYTIAQVIKDTILIPNGLAFGKISREKECVTFLFGVDSQVDHIRIVPQFSTKLPFTKVQVILRLYQTPSEILHGFDVDSCCLGYDGDNVWMTDRCWFALENGYNTVNMDRLSRTYELRLAKYGRRAWQFTYRYWADMHSILSMLTPSPNRTHLGS